jgi:multisubunit Na+/H+ antiporter MnhG subunit
MAFVLSNEEEALYTRLKDVYNRATNAGELYTVEILHDAFAHYISVSGWIGRHAWFVLPVAVLIGMGLGAYLVAFHR